MNTTISHSSSCSRRPLSVPFARSVAGLFFFALFFAFFSAASFASAATISISFEGAGGYDPSFVPANGATYNDWLENGARYEGFWYDNPGQPFGSYNPGPHTHIGNGNNSPGGQGAGFTVGDEIHSWRGGLQGGLVSMIDGGGFDVVSIDYRLTRRTPAPDVSYSQQINQNWSFAADNIHLLLSADARPDSPDFASFENLWDAYDIDDGSILDHGDGTFDPSRPANGVVSGTVFPTGLTNITELYITHTGARVIIDNIVLEVGSGVGPAVPEPNVAMLLGLGLLVLAGRRYQPQAA